MLLLLAACTQSLKLTHDDSGVVLARQLLDAPDPSRTGSYAVKMLYYGSGTDRRRPHFRDSVTLKTATVDASKFVSMSPDVARSREKYWGFGAKKYPLNGTVWYPDGAGPFPLVLVVHGNHDMKKFSDPGYRYLGELLASRGFITVSVDENFVNGSMRGENDARAWLLLKHLDRWRTWNDSAGSPFYHVVDTTAIALIGHSRGGEAVAHAAAFNHLSRYPDDANISFDFNFGIRSIVAIAPVDGQYKPTGRFEPLENVDYMVIHGSHDGDVSTFNGLRQYDRLRFTDGRPHFKSAWYVYRANHGQWNTVWGSTDAGPRSGRYLDLRALISPEDQRQFAKVVIGAFLEATLRDRTEYLPLFRDHRVAGGWLPHTMYVTRFQESGFVPLATFEGDVDVTTGAAGVSLSGDSLATWKEEMLTFRSSSGDPMYDNAVRLGWNRHISGADTLRLGSPASYTVSLSDSLASAIASGPRSAVYISLAPTNDTPGPRKAPRDSTHGDSARSKMERPKPERKKSERDTTPVDATVELVDANGVAARLPLSRFGVPRRPLEAHVLRRADHEKERFKNAFEIVLQTYVMPLDEFARVAPAFAPDRLRSISLVFDRTPAGTVLVDDIGISNIDPAFMAARLP